MHIQHGARCVLEHNAVSWTEGTWDHLQDKTSKGAGTGEMTAIHHNNSTSRRTPEGEVHCVRDE